MLEPKRVLIVEDREDFQKIFREIVGSLGYSSRVAADLKASLNELARYSFDVALVDLRLNDEDKDNWDGFEVLKRIKAINEWTKPIVLTAFGEVEHASEAFREYHVFDFIRKMKMDIHDVADKIQKAAEEAGQEAQRKALQFPLVTSQIKGLGTEQIQEQFEATASELEPFLRRLLHGLQPLLADKHPAQQMHLSTGEISYRARFWSRGLGEPILVWFGQLAAMERLLETLDEAALQEMGGPRIISRVFDSYSFPHFGGAVFTVAQPHDTLADFESLPTH